MTLLVPTYSAEQVRAAEQPLLAVGEPLMARAAAALAHVASEFLETRIAGSRARILILAGSGNNGGDALFAAAHLARHAAVDVLTLSERWHEAGLDAAIEAGARRIRLDDLGAGGYDLVLDGILGIGTASSPNLRGAAREAVQALLPCVRKGRTRVIAVDIPSGLHPDTGEHDDTVLPASVTVTFGAVKQGLARRGGAEFAGDIVLVRIGIESALASAQPLGEASVGRVIDASGGA